MHVTYARNQWTALRRYTEDGRLTIDNNVSERTLRHQAVGRKNWLFLGSEAAGPRAAVLYTILAGAKRHRIEPWAYVRDLLLRIHADDQCLEELLPNRGAAAQPEAGVAPLFRDQGHAVLHPEVLQVQARQRGRAQDLHLARLGVDSDDPCVHRGHVQHVVDHDWRGLEAAGARVVLRQRLFTNLPFPHDLQPVDVVSGDLVRTRVLAVGLFAADVGPFDLSVLRGCRQHSGRRDARHE